MIPRAAVIGLLFAISGETTELAAQPAMDAPGPRVLVESLYKVAVAENKRESPTSPFYEPADRRLYFSAGFKRLIAQAEAKATKAGAPMLDFDPISDSQDAELKDVKVSTDHVEGDTASVSASFTNHDQGSVVTYHLVQENHAWKVDDIEGSADKTAWSVRKLLEAAP